MAFLVNSAYADNAGWALQRDKEGIQVYARKTQGHLTREYKGIAYAKVPLAGAIALFEDTNRIPEWMYRCKEFRELSPKNSGENIFYFRQGLPAPAHERDVVVSRIQTQDPLTNTVFYAFSHISGRYPVQENVRRMPYFKSMWRFTPRQGGTVEVEYRFQSDPGGHVPVWLLDNIIYVDLPFYSLRRFRELAQEPRYKNTTP